MLRPRASEMLFTAPRLNMASGSSGTARHFVRGLQESSTSQHHTIGAENPRGAQIRSLTHGLIDDRCPRCERGALVGSYAADPLRVDKIVSTRLPCKRISVTARVEGGSAARLEHAVAQRLVASLLAAESHRQSPGVLKCRLHRHGLQP